MKAGAVAKQKTTRERTGLEVRIAARQEANREARATKLTGEDVQRRLEERRTERAAKKAPKPVGHAARTVSIALGFAMLVGTGIIAVSTTNGATTFQNESAANQAQIAKAQAVLSDIPASDKTAAAAYSTKLTSQLKTARTKGQEVAALQQDFQSILVAGNTEQTTGGLASKADTAAAAHRKTLAPYFGDRALIVKDTAAYAPGSVLPFDDDQIDPRFAWHITYEGAGTTVAAASASTWALTSMIATETPGVFEATWTDTRTSDHDLLAWATASYYTSQGKFGSLRVGQTTLGSTGALNNQTAAN
jgi:hypothetical protein